MNAVAAFDFTDSVVGWLAASVSVRWLLVSPSLSHTHTHTHRGVMKKRERQSHARRLATGSRCTSTRLKAKRQRGWWKGQQAKPITAATTEACERSASVGRGGRSQLSEGQTVRWETLACKRGERGKSYCTILYERERERSSATRRSRTLACADTTEAHILSSLADALEKERSAQGGGREGKR